MKTIGFVSFNFNMKAFVFFQTKGRLTNTRRSKTRNTSTTIQRTNLTENTINTNTVIETTTENTEESAERIRKTDIEIAKTNTETLTTVTTVTVKSEDAQRSAHAADPEIATLKRSATEKRRKENTKTTAKGENHSQCSHRLSVAAEKNLTSVVLAVPAVLLDWRLFDVFAFFFLFLVCKNSGPQIQVHFGQFNHPFCR